MSRKLLNVILLPALAFSSSMLLIVSCESGSRETGENLKADYPLPETKAFTLPEAKPIPWKEFPADSLPKISKVRFDLNKLPSKAFSANEFKPLKQPMRSSSFNFNKLTSISLKIDSADYKPLKYRKFILPAPQVSSASIPGITGKGTAGISRLGPIEGLPGAKVYSIIEDQDGAVWISTDRGISKYTGTEFLTYQFLAKEETGAIEAVLDMMTDSSGRLLIAGLTSGIYRIDTRNGIAEHFQSTAPFVKIAYDRFGRLWGSNGNEGLTQIDLERKQAAKVFVQKDSTELKNVYGLKTDASGNFWVGFNNKIGIIDTGFTTMRIISTEEGLTVNIAFEFDEDSQDNMWVTSAGKGALSISLKNQLIRTMGVEQGFTGSTFDAYTDARDRVWLVGNDTIYILDEKAGKMKKMVTNAPNRTTNFPSSGMIGRDGTLWLGSNVDGALLINPNGMLADHFTELNGLESNDVWGVAEDSKGRIWLSTYRGINIYDPVSERLSLLKFPPEISLNHNRQIDKIGPDLFFLGSVGGFALIDVAAGEMTYYNTRLAKASEVVFMGFPDKNGAIWLCGGNGILVYDPKQKTLKRFDETGGLISQLVFVLEKDKSGRIWACTEKGTAILFPDNNTFVNLSEANGLTGSYSAMFFESAAGNIYVASDKGFSMFDQELKTITNITEANGMKPPAIYDMTEKNNRLFFGTENGITILEEPGEPGKPLQFYNYAKSAGFPYNDYNQSTAFVSSNGDMWWGAAPILTVVHQNPVIDTTPPTAQIKGMNIMDQHPDFFSSSLLKKELKQSDSIWIGDKAYTTGSLPKDSGYLSQKKIRWDSIRSGFQIPVGLQLPFDQNSFNFSFINQSTKARDKIVYRYILEGEDKTWSDPGVGTVSRIYYNIKPGQYTFKVVSKDFNGVWSQPDSLEFTILPPWWQTWWAYTLFALIAGSLIYLIVRVRSKMLEKENRILEKKVAHRTQALHQKMEELQSMQNQLVQSEKMASLGELTAGIAHEIQNPLNFINNFAEINKELLTEMYEELDKGNWEAVRGIAADVESNETKIYHHGRRADAIVKSMLQHSRSTNNLVKEPTEINKLADEYLRLAYHGLRAKDKSFNATMHTDFDESISPISIVPQDIGRVVLNLINNAFYAVTEKKRMNLPGYEPTVTVRTKNNQQSIEIMVEDNGNGIPAKVLDKIFQPFFTTKPTGQGTGLGLSMSYDIVKKVHGGDLKVDSKEGTGTKFTIVLPAKP